MIRKITKYTNADRIVQLSNVLAQDLLKVAEDLMVPGEEGLEEFMERISEVLLMVAITAFGSMDTTDLKVEAEGLLDEETRVMASKILHNARIDYVENVKLNLHPDLKERGFDLNPN